MEWVASALTALQQIDPPSSLVGFMWAAVGSLVAAVGFLYRQYILLQHKYVELLEKQFSSVNEINLALLEVTKALSSLEASIELKRSLREAIAARNVREEGRG